MIRHVDNDLNSLKDLLLSMGGCVERALGALCLGLDRRQPALFKEVEAQELRIDQAHCELDQACLLLLAKQAPMARDLRMVLAVAKINTDLERMGDLANNITYAAQEFLEKSRHTMPPQWDQMMAQVRAMVKTSLDGFVSLDPQMSHQVLAQDDLVDELRNQMISQFRTSMKQNASTVDACCEAISMVKNLERIADHATNIAEEIVFVVTGRDIRHSQNKYQSNFSKLQGEVTT